MIKTQVTVVGAGPGGCTTAIALAQKGIDCVLVDKAVFPRHKACGEVITSNCIRELATLDRAIFDDLQNADFNFDITGNTFVAPNQYSMEMEYKSPHNERMNLPHCYTASRYDFDNFLVQSIKKRYPQVQVVEGCNLNSFETENGYAILKDKKGKTIKSRLVIFANGAGNALTKRASKVKTKPKHEAVGIRAYLKNVLPSDQPQMAEFYFFKKKYMPYGLYITPLTNGMVNINTMVRKDIAKKRNINMREMMWEFIRENPTLNERFANAEMVGKVHGCSLELGSRWWKVSGDNFMLVGDAAGLIDATNANGIGHAMISGQMAADFAKRSLEANDTSAKFLKTYDNALRKRMSNSLKLSRMVSPFFTMPYFTSISTWLLNYWMKKSNDSQLLIKLMYSKNAGKELLKPSFYYSLLFK